MTKNIVLVTNEINPYRKSFYDRIYNYCQSMGVKFTVLLMTKVERGYNWNYDEVKADYAILMKGRHLSFPINNYINTDVIRHLKELRPDIVIMAGSYFYFTNWLVIAKKHKLNYPVYFWSETHFQELRKYGSLKHKIREIVRQHIYPRFDGFWYGGKMSHELIKHYAAKTALMHFVPNLIDHTKYSAKSTVLRQQKYELRQKWGIPNGHEIIITPARLSWVKGIHTFLDLLKKSSCRKRVTMLIPGTGNYQAEISDKIKETGLDVRLLGYQQQDSVIELYALADFFVMPSLSDPNPLTCIEALWCGLPLMVSTHVGNHPEVIRQGENGYVFDYSKPDEAVGLIDRMLTSSAQWRQKAGEISVSIASEFYDADKVVPRLIDNLINETNLKQTAQ